MEEKFETVISGISGRFPDCENISEFKTKLYNGKSFMSVASNRWPINYRYQYTDTFLPSKTGKFKHVTEFDPAVFKMNHATAECTDIVNRKIFEPAFEAVMDSGLNPYDLSGRNIGVYMAYDHSDCDSNSAAFWGNTGRLWVMGSSKTMMSNRISFALNLKGPSLTYANDMFGNFTALDEAFKHVSRGFIEAAIVGIVSCVQHPLLSVNLTKMNVLSMDSLTRVFDKNANGYGRSDSAVALFIQRADDAKRIYATIDFTGYTYFGSNPNSFCNFDEDLLTDSVTDLYEKNDYYDIDDVSFVEMSACGIEKYDKTESNFIAETFCKTKKHPLLVGSVKSNVGMADSAGPYVSLIKALFALESGVVAQNINLNEINDRIEAFNLNKLKVITKPTYLSGDKIVVNSVGIAGALSQVVLKQNLRRKKSKKTNPDGLPRLILACARTEDGIYNVLKKIEQTTFNEEYISIVNDVFGKDMPFHVFRGYSIISSSRSDRKMNSANIKGNKTRPVWYIFSGMGSQWNKMGEGLLKFPIIFETVKKCDQVLRKVGVDIYHLLSTDDPTIFDNIMHSFVGIITIQIALVEVLKALGIKPDGIIGHSVGENACAYADGCLTLEQAVLSSYARGMASIETKTTKGMMAAVGKGYNEMKNILPENIEIACHNSANSCTLSGPAEDVEKYVEYLQERNVFAKAVNVANIAYHSKHIAPAAPNLLTRLKKVIPKPLKRSPLWVSTSIPESDWDKPLAQYCSAEYLTNNLLNSVLFEEGSKHIPSDALVIEIAPHGLLQAIVKRSLPETCANVSLTARNKDGKNVENLLNAIGKLYIEGLDVNVNALYPPIQYPVPEETPPISHLARWYPSNPDAGLSDFDLVGSHSGDPIIIHINNDSPYYYLKDHKVHNRIILPTAFFLYLTWWVDSVIRNSKLDLQSVIFEDVVLHKNVSMSLNKCRKFAIFIQKGSGQFEILKCNKSKSKKNPTRIMSGVLYLPEKSNNHIVDETTLRNTTYTISSHQFYKLFKDIGYQLNGMFNCTEELKYNKTDCYAKIKWNNNWVSFLDSLLKFNMFCQIKNETDLLYTYKIRKLEISADEISRVENGTTLLCHKEFCTNIITCRGLKLYSAENRHLSLGYTKEEVKFEGLRFVSHDSPRCQNVSEFLKLCLQIANDNIGILSKNNRPYAKLHLIIDNHSVYYDLLKNMSNNCDFLKNRIIFHDSKQMIPNDPSVRNACCISMIDNPYNTEKLVNDFSFFIIALSDDETVSNKMHDNYMLITKQHFADKVFYLFKKKNSIQNEYIRTVQLESSYVKKNHSSEPIFITKQNIDTADLSVMLKNDRKFSDPRYLFVMDNNIPSDAVLENQRSQDLPVAVLQNGEWGSYRNLSENLSKSEKNNETFQDISEDIRFESIDIRYLCGYEEIKSQDDQVCNYGVEYSGVQYSGERVMGLSLIDSCHPVSKPDAILKWKVPKYWTLEDATTIPFVYTQAYYMLDEPVIRGKMYVDSILINACEEGPLCEACISISLSRNQKVFVAVDESKEALFIRNKFPQLDPEQILNKQECSFRAEVLKMTNGRGVDLVVNFSVDIEVMTELMKCIDSFGYFLQIGKVDNWEMLQIGLRPFLNGISFIPIQNRISSILKLSNKEKQSLKFLIEEGIKTCVVTPFDKIVHIQGMSEISNESAVKNRRARKIFKVFPKINSSCYTSETICYDDKRSYIIVGGRKNKNSWFELVEWMVNKGARKFIVIQESLTAGLHVSHRMNRLVNKKKVIITFNSYQELDTIRDAENVILKASKIGPLEAVFFISLASADEKIYNMDLATRQFDSGIHIVSLFSGGLKECESRRFAGLPATVIHDEKSSRKLSSILPQIDCILSQFDNCNSPTLYRILNIENQTSESSLRNYLSHDIATLDKIGNDLTNDLKFIEVTTKAPRYSCVKDCFPIFIISSLGPRPLHGLISNLMSPAFCSSIGYNDYTIKESASKLYDSLNSIQSKAGVTLLSETWSTPIAFEMIKLLEEDKRKYRLFTLEGNPLTWKNRIRNFGKPDSNQFENNLITHLFNADLEMHSENIFGVNQPLSEKLSNYLRNLNYPPVNVFNLIKVIHSIRHGLEIISQYEYDNELLKNIVSIVKYREGNELLNLSVTSESFVHEEEDYFKFLSAPRVCSEINKGVIYTVWCD